MALELTATVDYISRIDIAGVRIKNYETLPTEFDSREFPILAPDVFQPIQFQPVARDSFGSGSTARQTIVYLMPYVLACYSQGEGRGLQDILPGMAKAVSKVATALIKNDTPTDDVINNLTVDLMIQSAQLNTTVNDPKGNGYHGAKIILKITEYVDGVD